MKLRIHENSLRLRVNRPDLEALRRDGSIEHHLAIAPGKALVYRLAIGAATEITAELINAGDGCCVTVWLPHEQAERWYDDAEVSLSEVRTIAGQAPLELLIEKDFACLVPRQGEDQSTYFVNPAGSQD